MKTSNYYPDLCEVYFKALTLIVLCSPPALAQNTLLPWASISSGFGTSAAANSRVVSDVGQSFVGSSQQANSVVRSGFLVHPLLRGPLVGISEQELLPTVYTLHQNYPNPFNPSTTIKYQLPVQTHVVLKLYDVLGGEVATLVNELQDAGSKAIQWNAVGLASGVYLYKLIAGDFVQTKKLLLLK